MDAREGEEHVLLPLLQCDVPYDVQRSRMCLFQEAPPAPLSRGPCREDDPAESVGSKCHNSSGCCPRRLETTKRKPPRTAPRRVMKNCALHDVQEQQRSRFEGSQFESTVARARSSMPAMQTTFARVKEENLLSFLRLCSPHPGVIPSYPAAKRRPSTHNRQLIIAPFVPFVELNSS